VERVYTKYVIYFPEKNKAWLRYFESQALSVFSSSFIFSKNSLNPESEKPNTKKLLGPAHHYGLTVNDMPGRLQGP
jgi:hypothetical protein